MLAYHPNGKLVASAHYDHVVRLWNMESRPMIRFFTHGG